MKPTRVTRRMFVRTTLVGAGVAAGGIRSMGGAKLELLLGDSQTKVEVARAEAERLINSGAQLLTGAFHSAHVATIAP
ncbi:MAG: hypothetical protein HYU26_06215, partial [Candidatus Rokubacteria bacterium]|nr:hypothetical protein [Candidatus Rokubacteria bacterium]